MSLEQIDAANRDFESQFNKANIKQAVGSYAEDARLFATDKHIYQGLNEIEQYYNKARSEGHLKVELHTGEIIACGNDHLVEIRFVLQRDSKSNVTSPFSFASSYKLNDDGGNYVVLWRKDASGQWKKLVDIFN